PDYAEAYYNRGLCLRELGKLAEAATSYERAIALNPAYADAYCNLAHVQHELKATAAAVASYEMAFALNSNLDFLHGDLVWAKMRVCDWRGLEASRSALATEVEQGKKSVIPFSALAALESEELHKKVVEIFVRTEHPARASLGPIAGRSR